MYASSSSNPSLEQKLWFELCQFFIAEFKRWRLENSATSIAKAKEIYGKMVSNAQYLHGKTVELDRYMCHSPDPTSQPWTLMRHLRTHRDGLGEDSDTTSYENFKKVFRGALELHLKVTVDKNIFETLLQSYAKHSDLYTWVTGVAPATFADPVASAVEASAASSSEEGVEGIDKEACSSWLEVCFFIDREIQRLIRDREDLVACWKACDIDAAFERALAQFIGGSCLVGEFFRHFEGEHPSLQKVFSQARTALLLSSTEASQHFGRFREQLGEETLIQVQAVRNLPALRWMKFCEVLQAQLLRLTLQLRQEDQHGQIFLADKIEKIQTACDAFTRFTDQQVPIVTLLDHRFQENLAEWTLREALTQPRHGERGIGPMPTAWKAFAEEFPNEQTDVAVDTEHLQACLAKVSKEAAQPAPKVCVIL